MSAAKRQRRRAPKHGTPAMHAEVDALAAAARARGEQPNAEEIYRALAPRYNGDLPIARTLRGWLKDTARASVWRATRSSVAERVLPTLARVVEHTHGAVQQLTTREADVIAAVVDAGPLADPLQAYYIALDYIAAEDRGEESYIATLDLQLAFAPWTSDEARRRYEAAVANEYVAVPMGHLHQNESLTAQLAVPRTKNEHAFVPGPAPELDVCALKGCGGPASVHDRPGPVVARVARGPVRGETMTGARYAAYLDAVAGRSAPIIAMRGAPASDRSAAAPRSGKQKEPPFDAKKVVDQVWESRARAVGTEMRDKRDKRGKSPASR